MNNRFNLNEEEKNHIRGLHNINEDAGMDTPGGNPDYFYGDGQLQKLRKKYGGNYTKDAEDGATYDKDVDDDTTEMSKEDIIDELRAIYSYSQDGAPELVNSALEKLLYNLGGFERSINEARQHANMLDIESKQPINEQDSAHKTYSFQGDKDSPATAGQLETVTNLMLTEMHENYMSDRNILLYLTRIAKKSEGKTM